MQLLLSCPNSAWLENDSTILIYKAPGTLQTYKAIGHAHVLRAQSEESWVKLWGAKLKPREAAVLGDL